MTRAQRTLYSMLMAENKKAKADGQPYLRNGKQTISSITESISEEGAASMVQSLRDGSLDENFRANQEEERDWSGPEYNKRPAGRIEFILWEIYLLDYSGTPWEEMQRALVEIFQQTAGVYEVSQNVVTNALPVIFRDGLQMDLMGDATGATGSKKTLVEFKIENAAEHELRVTTKKLMDYFLKIFAETKQSSVAAPIQEYAALVKTDVNNKGAMDALRRQVVEDLETLGAIQARYYEKVNGRMVYSGYKRLNGGTAKVDRDGTIRWNWNEDIAESLRNSNMAPIDYSAETFAADPRTSQYYFSRWIDLNFRINEGKPREQKVFIATLLARTDKIPDIDKLQAQRGNVRERVIRRFFRDLDALERIYYDVYTKEGELVRDPLNMSITDFRNGYLMVDYSDNDRHPDRTKKRDRKKREDATRRSNTKKTKELEARVKALEDAAKE